VQDPRRLIRIATKTIPIVFITAEDPVRAGLVASLARPGGNATGINLFTLELVAKRLELLRELAPAAATVAVLINPANTAFAETTLRDIEPASRGLGLQIQVHRASTSNEIDAVFATFVRTRPDALFVGNDPFFTTRRVQLAIAAARYSIPAAFGSREIAEAGGLMSYGSNIVDGWHQLGADPAHAIGRLRPRRERPRRRRAAEQRDELAPLHSITSSAATSSLSGTSRPSALAVLRLITNSNRVDCTTGRSAGCSPLRTRPV
jgi:ABC transporter substrate binding protein